MSKKRISKVVGTISEDIIQRYKLYEYQNVEIIQSLDFYVHVQKHINEFQSVDSYNKAVINIPDIISDPLFVYYNKDKKSLLYFKKIEENVCAVVKLNLRKNKDTYVSTIYPISEKKIQKYKELSYMVDE